LPGRCEVRRLLGGREKRKHKEEEKRGKKETITHETVLGGT